MELGFNEAERQKILDSNRSLMGNANELRDKFIQNYAISLKDSNDPQDFLKRVQELRINMQKNFISFDAYYNYLNNLVLASYNRCKQEKTFAESTIKNELTLGEFVAEISDNFNNFMCDEVARISDLVASYLPREYLPPFIDGNMMGVAFQILGIDDFGRKLNEIVQDIGTKYIILSKNKTYLTSLERAKLITQLKLNVE
ncbi:sodium:calcium antiporter [Helicobacter pylori]|nr:sodium:calcium antiporter [Helicobacter pylori]